MREGCHPNTLRERSGASYVETDGVGVVPNGSETCGHWCPLKKRTGKWGGAGRLGIACSRGLMKESVEIERGFGDGHLGGLFFWRWIDEIHDADQ